MDFLVAQPFGLGHQWRAGKVKPRPDRPERSSDRPFGLAGSRERGNGDRRHENKADRARHVQLATMPPRAASARALTRWAPACSGNQFCRNSACGAEPSSTWRGRSNQRQQVDPHCQYALRQPRDGAVRHQGRAHLPPARTRSSTLKQPSGQGTTERQASGAKPRHARSASPTCKGTCKTVKQCTTISAPPPPPVGA